MGELASGIAGSASGPIRNAYDPRRHASGSSGGTVGRRVQTSPRWVSARTRAALSAVPRRSASLVGLRPTLPLVSRYGMLPARPSTDTVGPMARTVKDAAIVLDAIAGYDPNDPATAYAVGHVPRLIPQGSHATG